MFFPSWHIMEDYGFRYVAYLYETEYDYRHDERSEEMSGFVDIDSAVEKAVDKRDCYVYEVDPFDFGVIDILHSPYI